MPRVKGLTTGSVPSFLDVILNFAESDTSSSLAAQDTWLGQLKAHLHADETGVTSEEGKLIFYGDDTWLKLFPSFFSHHDGTSSFFVSVSLRPIPPSRTPPYIVPTLSVPSVASIEYIAERIPLQDFTEVDNNVTRHLAPTLANPNWDALIMHYLGLDHIGHKSGPKSPNMYPKQQEMDSIVQQIYHSFETQPHLQNAVLVLVGDHGMNSAGNHGGSLPGETSAAMLFASPKFRTSLPGKKTYRAPVDPRDGTEFEFYRRVEQIDVVPTLAALMGVPVPGNNLGVLVPEMLGFWSSDLALAGRTSHLGSEEEKEKNENESNVVVGREAGKEGGEGFNALEDDALHLLYRNALQILEIVKATFGAGFFTGVAGSSMRWRCSGILKGRDALVCKWALAQRMLLASSVDGRFGVEKIADALTDVSTMSNYRGLEKRTYRLRISIGR